MSLGRRAAAEATTSRAVPVLSACSARARAEAMSKCGDRPRYGIDLVRGKRDDQVRGVGVRDALEGREEKPRVGGELLDVRVGRDHDHHPIAAAARRRQRAPSPPASARSPPCRARQGQGGRRPSSEGRVALTKWMSRNSWQRSGSAGTFNYRTAPRRRRRGSPRSRRHKEILTVLRVLVVFVTS